MGLPFFIMSSLALLGLFLGVFPAVKAAAEPHFSITLVARMESPEGNKYNTELTDGDSIYSGDGLQIWLRSERDAYIYVLIYGASHSALLIHPLIPGDDEEARMRGGQERIIPAPDQYLTLDDKTGWETIIAIAADMPVRDVSGLLQRMEQGGGDIQAVTREIRSNYPSFAMLRLKHIDRIAAPDTNASMDTPSGTEPRARGEPEAATAGAEENGGVGGDPYRLLPPSPASRPFGSDGFSSWLSTPREADIRPLEVLPPSTPDTSRSPVSPEPGPVQTEIHAPPVPETPGDDSLTAGSAAEPAAERTGWELERGQEAPGVLGGSGSKIRSLLRSSPPVPGERSGNRTSGGS